MKYTPESKRKQDSFSVSLAYALDIGATVKFSTSIIYKVEIRVM